MASRKKTVTVRAEVTTPWLRAGETGAIPDSALTQHHIASGALVKVERAETRETAASAAESDGGANAEMLDGFDEE